MTHNYHNLKIDPIDIVYENNHIADSNVHTHIEKITLLSPKQETIPGPIVRTCCLTLGPMAVAIVCTIPRVVFTYTKGKSIIKLQTISLQSGERIGY